MLRGLRSPQSRTSPYTAHSAPMTTRTRKPTSTSNSPPGDYRLGACLGESMKIAAYS